MARVVLRAGRRRAAACPGGGDVGIRHPLRPGAVRWFGPDRVGGGGPDSLSAAPERAALTGGRGRPGLRKPPSGPRRGTSRWSSASRRPGGAGSVGTRAASGGLRLAPWHESQGHHRTGDRCRRTHRERVGEAADQATFEADGSPARPGPHRTASVLGIRPCPALPRPRGAPPCRRRGPAHPRRPGSPGRPRPPSRDHPAVRATDPPSHRVFGHCGAPSDEDLTDRPVGGMDMFLGRDTASRLAWRRRPAPRAGFEGRGTETRNHPLASDRTNRSREVSGVRLPAPRLVSLGTAPDAGPCTHLLSSARGGAKPRSASRLLCFRTVPGFPRSAPCRRSGGGRGSSPAGRPMPELLPPHRPVLRIRWAVRLVPEGTALWHAVPAPDNSGRYYLPR